MITITLLKQIKYLITYIKDLNHLLEIYINVYNIYYISKK
jgi:hypothetical protein